jgi:hypothetical protein
VRVSWPAVAVIAAVVAGLAVVAPRVLASLVPVVVVLACPLSMLVMARTVARRGNATTSSGAVRDDADPSGRS